MVWSRGSSFLPPSRSLCLFSFHIILKLFQHTCSKKSSFPFPWWLFKKICIGVGLPLDSLRFHDALCVLAHTPRCSDCCSWKSRTVSRPGAGLSPSGLHGVSEIPIKFQQSFFFFDETDKLILKFVFCIWPYCWGFLKGSQQEFLMD